MQFNCAVNNYPAHLAPEVISSSRLPALDGCADTRIAALSKIRHLAKLEGCAVCQRCTHDAQQCAPHGMALAWKMLARERLRSTQPGNSAARGGLHSRGTAVSASMAWHRNAEFTRVKRLILKHNQAPSTANCNRQQIMHRETICSTVSRRADNQQRKASEIKTHTVLPDLRLDMWPPEAYNHCHTKTGATVADSRPTSEATMSKTVLISWPKHGSAEMSKDLPKCQRMLRHRCSRRPKQYKRQIHRALPPCLLTQTPSPMCDCRWQRPNPGRMTVAAVTSRPKPLQAVAIRSLMLPLTEPRCKIRRRG